MPRNFHNRDTRRCRPDPLPRMPTEPTSTSAPARPVGETQLNPYAPPVEALSLPPKPS